VVEDVGNTAVTPADVARIYGENSEEAAARIDRGRAKMSAWLALLEEMEDAEGGEATAPERREGQAAMAMLPSIGMPVTDARLKVAAKLRREGSAAFEIES
jgi:hypothetical protein